jgi:RNA polymerase sigma factor (sigma-70 family)
MSARRPEERRLDAQQQRLVTEHSHVVRGVQRRYRRLAVWLSHEEIGQLASLGMANAAVDYRREDGPFAAFCWAHAIGAVLRAVDREGRQRDIKLQVLDDLSATNRDGDVLSDTMTSAAAELRDHARRATVAYLLSAASRRKAAGVEAEALEAERRRIVREAIAELREELQQVVELHYVEELELKDVSVRLGVSYATVRRRNREIIQLLKARLAFAGLKR